jgi:hypothetical protein
VPKGQTLDRLMADTLAGRSRVTVLRGEPGVGRGPRRSRDLSDGAVAPDSDRSCGAARTSGIIRFPTPHDRGGGPCLPAHLAQSRRAWPGFAMPARSRKPSPRTCSSTWPPSPTRGVPWAAVRLGFPHAAQVIQVTRKRPSASRTPAPLRLVGCLRGRSGSTSERLTSPSRRDHLERRWLAQRWVLTRTEEVMGRPRYRVESQVSCPKPWRFRDTRTGRDELSGMPICRRPRNRVSNQRPTARLSGL